MTTDARVALVTAGTAGLGFGAARQLARRGHAVVVCGRSQERLDDAVAGVRSAGGSATGVRADVSRAADLDALVAAVERQHGRLDVLVANAGGPRRAHFVDLDDAAWGEAIDLVLMSAVRTVRLALPLLRASDAGRIILIGSSSVRRPIPGLTLSNVLRPALAGLVKSLVTELAPDGITVNMVAPGRIDTARVRGMDEWNAERRGQRPEDVRAASQASIPMGRYGRPDELGAVVAHLADPASAYVTGQTILVDGGHAPTLP